MNLCPIYDLDNKDPQTLIDNFQSLPCTANSGAHVVSISESLDHVVLRLPFNDQTTNFIGIMYGGSMYAATDAVYVVMLWYRLGYDYIVIDKASTVNYMRPGTEDLTAEFYIPESDIITIKNELKHKKSLTRDYMIRLVDSHNKLVCKISKTIVIRKNQ